MDTAKKNDLLKWAGVEDIPDFYRDRFYTDGILHAAYFDALSRFDINFARTLWVYDNVRPGSSVLELGCGAGVLALLKRKNVNLVGIDLSPSLLSLARRNGYDQVITAYLTALPFRDNYFDYVISLDVLGHVAFSEKQQVLSEIKRVLKVSGVTMHGIECLDRELHGDYGSMNEEKLRKFVAVDGHIGLEDDDEHVARFRDFFAHVEGRSRLTLCLSVAEIIKQADEYGVPFETDFVDYLRALSFRERRAFDMAMGYVFGKISDLDIKLPKSGLYMFLKASDAPLEVFYNAHRDRAGLLASVPLTNESGWQLLDRNAAFDGGWYAAEYLPPAARWMGRSAHVRFEGPAVSKLRLDLMTHMPALQAKALNIEILLNGDLVGAFCLKEYGWLQVAMDCERSFGGSGGLFDLEIRVDRTWQPCAIDTASNDSRELSIAVCNIEVAT
jgi:SAM-dependent methyltransferase